MSGIEECARWPEVEAAADGRFGPREVDRVERHLAQCAACRDRRARWEALREEARAHARAPLSDLARHRNRAALLRAAAAHGDERRPSRVAALALVGTLAAAGFAMVLLRDRERPTTPTPHAEARVDAASGAQWRRTEEPARETIHLAEGSLRVTVPHQHAGHRFVVALPDGELEVRGTQFIVEAHGGRTERVTVFEGLVALRVGGSYERLIAAGGRWQATEPAPTTTAVATAAPTPVTPPPVAPAAPPARRAEPAADDAFQRFAAGVTAMGRGDFRVAAESFEAFERQRPHDERADDAGWLRVVARRRGGDDAAALAAAERYLARYPAGAHRREAAALLRLGGRDGGVP